MLSKVFTRMFSTSTAPYVWVNKHTKVICQGITGNQVTFKPRREASRPSKLSTTKHKWLEESILKRPEPSTSDLMSLRPASRLNKPPTAMLLSSMCLLPEQLQPSSKLSRLSSISVWSSLMVR
jgi:hypothetical protein